MALIAIADLPYGYYTLMRLVVCATAVFVVVMAAKSRQMWAVWLFAIIGLLFNPLVPVHLTKGIWQPLDFLAAAALAGAAFAIRTGKAEISKSPPSA
jgi:putative Ca2+/H+ antiporter (TMEM165/GDT1 family)